MTDFTDATWRKASASNGNDTCVEVARVGDTVGLRDSKDPAGPVLEVAPAAFAAFVDGVRSGQL